MINYSEPFKNTAFEFVFWYSLTTLLSIRKDIGHIVSSSLGEGRLDERRSCVAKWRMRRSPCNPSTRRYTTLGPKYPCSLLFESQIHHELKRLHPLNLHKNLSFKLISRGNITIIFWVFCNFSQNTELSHRNSPHKLI